MSSQLGPRMNPPELWCWRHPRAIGAEGRCIGQTDIPLDPRKARRLAHRIRSAARKHGLPREVWVSPLARCRDVGRVLRAWGFTVHVDARLMELNFGRWDGQPWSAIAWAEVEAWQADLLHHAPGGADAGESLAALAGRVQAYLQAYLQEAAGAARPRLLVTHGGWLNALHLLPRLLLPAVALAATAWPAPPRHGSLSRWAAGPAMPAARS